MIVFEACYNPSIHECAYTTLSIHKTKVGATMAIEVHKARKKKKKIYPTKKMRKVFPVSKHEDWDVIETKVLP